MSQSLPTPPFADHGAWAGPETVAAIRQRFGDQVLGESDWRQEREVTVRREIVPALGLFLRDELGFEMLLDLCAVDHLGRREQRFEVVYHFYSLQHNARLRICVPLREDSAELPSLTGLWKAADWYEREVWDFYGIRFAGHPDLRRLLMYDQFKGHPLRKDYKMKARQPLIGPGARGGAPADE
jgi:NADH-quinone oxidoreductase subunit C